ncbi:aminotransferase-like domain-containing protein [Nocardiopsis potens]|uniref:aminotransferase-like domain-containing protein n=1 Tax=Nocardiopsis potens TaxID=1246458 RepID=UPI00034757A6|nr:PLP-dependent aminotransferase family protein [Nocardiopsis potens]
MGTRRIRAQELAALLGYWSAGRGPLYLLLAGRLRRLVDEGALPTGTGLPPDRALAAALAVGRTTVVEAYEVLRREGRIERRQGSGTRVAAAVPVPSVTSEDTTNPSFLQLLDPPAGTIVLSCAAPEEPPPEVALAYASLHLDGGLGLGYRPAGLPRLREALAERYRAAGVPTSPSQILVTTGGQQALSLLTELLVAPGDDVLVEAPTYSGALDLFRKAGAVLRPVARGSAELDVGEAVRVLEERRPSLAYLVANHHNPTGAVLPPLAARRLVEAAEAAGVPLIDDGVTADLALHDRPVPRPLSAYGEVIEVGSLSKVVWGGMRVGWLRAREELVARLARLKAVHDLGSDVPSQLAAVRILDDYEAVRSRRVKELSARHDLLRAELARSLPSWDFPPVEGGQTLWVRLPQGDAASFAQVAIRHGVALLPGGAIDAAGGSSDHLRLPFTGIPERIQESVRRLAEAWRVYEASPRLSSGAVALSAVVV